MCAGIYVSHMTAWAPGLETEADWNRWAHGEKEILRTKDAPKLEYTDALFRRRLSQISRMTIQVVHDELAKSGCGTDIKQVFVSCRGELDREFSVSRMLIEEHTVLPASFSLSVFNTPIALATLALQLHGGYTVLFPAKGDFRAAFAGACAPVLSGAEKQIMLVYADECIPEDYSTLGTEGFVPLAFAAVISASPGGGIYFDSTADSAPDPAAFLKQIIQKDTSLS